MPYQYVREPLTAEESDRRSNACETPTERLVVWTLLDTGLRVSELCELTPKNVLWQQRQLRFKGKGGPNGKKTKVRVVPMSNRVRALLEHHFALEKAFPVKTRRAQDIVKAVANRAGITKGREPARAAAHIRHDGLAEGGAIRKNRCLGAGFLFFHTPANNRRFPTLPSQGERPCPSANPANGDIQRRLHSNRGIASRRSGPRSRTSSSRSKPNATMGA